MSSQRRSYPVVAGLLILLLSATGIPLHADESELEAFIKECRMNVDGFRAILKRTRRLEIEAIGLSVTSEMCRITAPQLYHEFSIGNEIMLRRVSLRPRNIIVGHADAWEQAGLLHLQKLKNDGHNIAEIDIAELVTEPAGQYFRYQSPILVEEGCLKCHGKEKDIDSDTARSLMIHYPNDNATGYQTGDLIGAISIKKKYRPGTGKRESSNHNSRSGHNDRPNINSKSNHSSDEISPH